MRVIPFTEDHADGWDDLVERSPMATFLHSRLFLSYHGDRLRDASVLLTDKNGSLRALFPAALDPSDPARVASHPGATFGGLIHDGGMYADQVRDALGAVFSHYAAQGLERLLYKPVPHIYHRAPSADDVWALNALGATRVGCALSCAIDLSARRPPSSRRARSLKKALREGVGVSAEPALLTAFWPVLESTLERRYGAAPVHGLDEIELLRDRFPEAIRLMAGVREEAVVAGIVLFKTPRVTHIQYMASSETGMQVGALDAVAERCIQLAAEEGARYFDFGTSMANRGDELQSGLHRFKAEFGGGGVVHEYYDVALEGRDAAE